MQGFWPDELDSDGGSYYDGVIRGVDYEAQTVHIHYDDGDDDTAVPWSKTYLQTE